MNEKQAAVETPAWWRGASGPTNARLYHMCLAACALAAWLSLGSQVQLLIGSRGLLPLAPLVDSFARRGEPLGLRFPSLLVFDASDAAITAGVVFGTALAIAAL